MDQSIPTIVYNNQRESSYTNIQLKKTPVEGGLKWIMEDLLTGNIGSVLVEGGSRTINSFIGQELWDEARVFTSRQTFDTGIQAPELELEPKSIQRIEKDELKTYYRSQCQNQ